MSALALAFGGCGERSAAPGATAIPRVETTGLETAVADRIAVARATVKANPASAASWGALGAVLDVHGLTDEAIPCYEEAERLDPDDFRWPYFNGVCRFVGDEASALAAFQRAHAIRESGNAPYAPLEVYLGRGLFLLEDIDASAVHFRRAVELDPTQIQAQIGLARTALALDDLDAAGRAVAAIESAGPRASETFWLMAEVARRRGEDERAATFATAAEGKALRESLTDPVRQELINEHGVSLQRRRARAQRLAADGDLAGALAEWNAAAASVPDVADPHIEIGLLSARMNRPDEAVRAWTTALAIDPSQATVRNNLGGVLVQLGRVEEGLTHLRAAAEAMPDRADVQYNIAVILRDAGNLGESRRALLKALEIDPGHARARFELGLLEVREGRYEDAERAFRAVVASAPERSPAWANLARAQSALGREVAAVATLREAIVKHPDDASLVNALAWALATSVDPAARNGNEAMRLAQKLMDSGGAGDPRILDTFAAALAETANFERAAEVANQAVSAIARLRPEPRLSRLREEIGLRVLTYRSGQPWRAEPPAAR